jgi:amino acid adenylation domain-containing protein
MQISILEYLEKTVKSNPEKTAIIDGDRKISFDQMNIMAKTLAVELCKLKCINKPIAVLLPKSIECIISDIAITYSGNMYMNLDVKTPEIRLGNIVRRIQPAAIITTGKYREAISNYSNDLTIILYEETDFNAKAESFLLDQVRTNMIDTDPLCIINTSGSTGTPKGAVLNHRSYIDYTDWAISTFSFNGNEILGVLSPVVFDHYNYEICLMMATGCTLVLLDNQSAAFPITLLEVLKKHKVTYIFWVPSIMVNIANMDLLNKISLPCLKMVWFAGEVFPTKQFNYWRKCLPDAAFVNLYGPVETSVDCTYYIADRDLKDEEPIPIGFPCRNTDILILNNQDKPAAINEEGELCVRGTSLAMGYYNNPEKTAAVFVQNPLNAAYPEFIYRTGDIVSRNEKNEIIFKGRKDTLIKHVGYRIELGEIEHVIINTLKLVETGCVVYNFTKKEIILFYEANQDISVASMRKAISEVFPKYMIPNNYIRMDTLPKNSNGKIDRLLLNEMVNKI